MPLTSPWPSSRETTPWHCGVRRCICPECPSWSSGVRLPCSTGPSGPPSSAPWVGCVGPGTVQSEFVAVQTPPTALCPSEGQQTPAHLGLGGMGGRAKVRVLVSAHLLGEK